MSSLSLGTSSQSACLGFNFLVLIVNREKPEVLQNSAEPETSANVNPQMRYFITPGSQIILRRAEKGMKGAREQAAEGGRVRLQTHLQGELALELDCEQEKCLGGPGFIGPTLWVLPGVTRSLPGVMEQRMFEFHLSAICCRVPWCRHGLLHNVEKYLWVEFGFP